MSFRLTDEEALSLLEEFGTPLYVMDEATMVRQVVAFRAALDVPYPTRLSYASKANSLVGVLRVMNSLGCHIDVASPGELAAALRAGVSPDNITLHGNAKKREDLAAAISRGVGEIVVDCFEEIELLAGLPQPRSILLRVNPAVRPDTQDKISTARPESKFGFPLDAVEEAISSCRRLGLPLRGLHMHVGSQLMETSEVCVAACAVAELVARYNLDLLDLGGGMGVRYADEEPLPLAQFVSEVVDAVSSVFGDRPVTLAFEPGRWLVAEAGVTLYRVMVVKGNTVAVDGGLSDNPRPALYGAKYEAALIRNPSPPEGGRGVAPAQPRAGVRGPGEAELLSQPESGLDVPLPGFAGLPPTGEDGLSEAEADPEGVVHFSPGWSEAEPRVSAAGHANPEGVPHLEATSRVDSPLIAPDSATPHPLPPLPLKGARGTQDDPSSPSGPAALSPPPAPSPQSGEGVLTTPYELVGSHCESDVLIPSVTFLQKPKRGDLVQVLVTGAYSASMASNYNRFCRPATVLRTDPGEFRLIQRRETIEEQLAREEVLD